MHLEFKKPHTKKVILFDLDETLAHCVRHKNVLKQPDVFLNVPTPKGKILEAGFNIRPYCKEILECANRYFEVCVFTASNQDYADTILDYIDPTGELIQHRFYRESCIKTTDNFYVKDLRIFQNVDLKDLILVDNAVYSFSLQLDNGIPVTPFKEDPEDDEFKHLIPHLEKCAKAEDMRDINRTIFRFSELSQYNFDSFIDYYDYEECEKIMEEDDELQYDRQRLGSTGSNSSEHRLGKSVSNALDALSSIMAENNGSLPL